MGDPLRLVPVAAAQEEPRARRPHVRHVRVHLVACRVFERLLRVVVRLRRHRPRHEDVPQVPERPGRVLALAGGVGQGVRAQQGTHVRRIHLHPRAADVHERVRACALVPEARRQAECALAPPHRLLPVVRQHRELRHAAAGARQLDGVAERLQDGDRLERLRPRRRAVADEPMEARQHARAPAERRLVAELAVDRDRGLDGAEALVEAPDEIRRGGELLQQVGLLQLGQPAGEVGGAAVVEVRLAVRLERGRAARGHERVLAHDLLVGGRLGVVHDVGRVRVRGEQCREHRGVQAAAAQRRKAGQHRVPRELVAEPHVGAVQLQQLAPLRLLRGGGPAGQHAVEHVGAHPVRHHRHQLHEAARGVVEPRHARDHRLRHRRRRLLRVPRGHQLGHVERVAAGGRVDHVAVVARELADRGARQRRELDQHEVVLPHRAEHPYSGWPGGASPLR